MSIHDRCPETGEYEDIDIGFCEEMDCRKSSCEYYPTKVKATEKRHKEFTSSEFGKETLKMATKVFGLTERQAELHLHSLSDNLQIEADSVVKEVALRHVDSFITAKLDAMIEALLETHFQKAVEDKMLAIQKNGKVLETTIQKMILEKLVNFFNSSSSQKYGTGFDEVDKVIKGLLDEKMTDALEELKRETIEKFQKEAMKKMMAGMAKAIGDDKKLLSMMTD